MSDKKPESGAASAAKSKKSLFVSVAVVGILGAGGFAGWSYMKPAAAADGEHGAAKKKAKAEHGDEHDEEAESEEDEHDESEAGGILKFEPFVVNLADTDARRFVRISVSLLVPEAELAEELGKEDPVTMTRLRADILEQLGAQTAAQLSSAEGKAALKKSIARQGSRILKAHKAKVTDVLFSDLVIQY